jgi:membrane associated rhomboid family serine protease/tetratricopeptide (TPR) repeat protein
MTEFQPLQPATPESVAELPPRPKRYWPWATLVTIAITFVVFFLTELAGGSKEPEVLIEFGAAYGPLFRSGQYWRLVMPIFLHIGWVHILLNMYGLYILGPMLERVYGYGRFSVLYLGAGIASSFLSMTVGKDISAGASGAIFGIAGAMLVTGFLRPEVVPLRLKRIFGRLLLVSILLELLLGLTIPNIDNWAHLGGLVGGMILAGLIPPLAPAHSTLHEEKPSQAWVWIPVTIVVVAMGANYQSFRTSKQVVRLIAEGGQLLAAHKDDQALERFKRAAELAPHDWRPHEGLGSAYLDLKRGADAESEFNQALKLDPNSPSAQLGLALAYRQQGELDKFKETFGKLLLQQMATPEGQLGLADMMAQRKLYAQAVQRYEAVLRARPKMAVAHNNLAWLYATSDDPNFRKPKEALEHAQKAVELSQWKQAAFIDTLAEALYVNQKFDEAVKVQAKALALEPDKKEYKDHMARYRDAAAKAAAGTSSPAQ